MAIQISKPITGGTGSVTTGSRVGAVGGSAAASQAADITALLDAFVQADIVKSYAQMSKPDTTKMTGRTYYSIVTNRKEAADNVISALNLLDNDLVVA